VHERTRSGAYHFDHEETIVPEGSNTEVTRATLMGGIDGLGDHNERRPLDHLREALVRRLADVERDRSRIG
jgi:hypothetical protein